MQFQRLHSRAIEHEQRMRQQLNDVEPQQQQQHQQQHQQEHSPQLAPSPSAQKRRSMLNGSVAGSLSSSFSPGLSLSAAPVLVPAKAEAAATFGADAPPSLGQCVACLHDYEGASTHLSFKRGDVIVVSALIAALALTALIVPDAVVSSPRCRCYARFQRPSGGRCGGLPLLLLACLTPVFRGVCAGELVFFRRTSSPQLRRQRWLRTS